MVSDSVAKQVVELRVIATTLGLRRLHSPYRMLAGENVSAAFVMPTVAACVDIVVHPAVDAAGHRRVRKIVGISGRVEGGEVIETSEIFVGRANRPRRFAMWPPSR